jgi:drug/metabolite transporter (DMT)-like permease
MAPPQAAPELAAPSTKDGPAEPAIAPQLAPTEARSAAVLPYVWMLAGALSFACMSFVAGTLREECPWQWIAVARTGLALLFALVIALSSGVKLVFLRPRTLWMRSIAGSISLVGGFYALTHHNVSEVLTLTNMFPLWVAVLSWPMLRETPPSEVWVAMAVGIIGVVVMQQPFASGTGGGSSLAIAAAVLSSFTSAVAMIGLHRLKEIDPRAIVVHFSAVSLAFCLVAVMIFPQETTAPLDWQTAALLLAMGMFATTGQLFLTKAFAAGPPARVSVVGLSQVGFAMLLELSISRRKFDLMTLVGIALVIAPTVWTLTRRAKTA